MKISLIVAMDERGGIGLRGRLPWHLSADLKHFKELTMGHSLVMGRKTYESIERALPGRKLVVITHQRDFQVEGAQVTHSLGEALELVRRSGESEVFVAGGGEVFADALRIADNIYLTRVQTVAEADTFFPDVDLEEWEEQVVGTHSADERNDHAFSWAMLVRKGTEPKGEGFCNRGER